MSLRTVWCDPPLLTLMGVFAAINFFAAGPIGVGLPVLAKPPARRRTVAVNPRTRE